MTEVPPPNIEKYYTQYKAYFIEPNQGSGVYAITCQCGEEYVGATKRNLHTRIKEHVRDSQKTNIPNISGLSLHMKETKHNIQSHKILERANSYLERNIKEAYHIIKRKPALNLDSGNLPSDWHQCISNFASNLNQP